MKTLATIITMMAMAVPLLGCKEGPPTPLEIVRAEATGPRGKVRIWGQVHNPRATPARSVVVSVEIFMDDCREEKNKPMRPATAKIDYLPAGATVDFAGAASYPEPDDYQLYKKGKVTITESGGGK